MKYILIVIKIIFTVPMALGMWIVLLYTRLFARLYWDVLKPLYEWTWGKK